MRGRGACPRHPGRYVVMAYIVMAYVRGVEELVHGILATDLDLACRKHVLEHVRVDAEQACVHACV